MQLTIASAEYHNDSSVIDIPLGYNPAKLWLLINGQVWTPQNFIVVGGQIVITGEDFSNASIQIAQNSSTTADEDVVALLIDSETGEYRYTFADHGRQITGDYLVMCETDSPRVTIDVSEKTPESFLLSAKSKGIHYKSQPVDCRKNPVAVSLKIIGG